MPTPNPSITISAAEPRPAEAVNAGLETLQASLENGNDAVKQALAKAIPTYHPSST